MQQRFEMSKEQPEIKAAQAAAENTIDIRLWLQTPLTNNNGGQTRHWTAAYDAKLEFESERLQA